MKRFAILIISFIFALTAFGTVTAFATSNGTVYPKDEDFIKPLTFSELCDFAINSDYYAFADGKAVKVFDGGNLTEYLFEEKVIALDCKEDVFYCMLEDEKVYSLPYAEGDGSVEYTMPDPVTTIDVGDYNYRLTSSALKVANFEENSIKTFDGEYKSLKKFGDSVYAILDNEVYKFDGDQSEKLSLNYADYTSTQKIIAGEAVTNLKEYTAPTLVSIKVGSHMTEADLSSFPDGYFITGKTVTSTEAVSAVLLCTTGNAAVIAVGRDCYILNSANIERTNETCYSTPEFEYGKITAAGDKIYASPYVSECTAILSGAAGITVKVLNKVQSAVLDSAFYEVEFEVSKGVTVKGYVTEKFLIKTDYVKEDDKGPDKIEDPNYTEDNNAKTIIIIFAVVILVLAGVGYLAYTGMGGKSKKTKTGKIDTGNKE